MIDFHTHILPHIDDGAKDTATSVAMMKEEHAQGVDTLVLTSHYYGKRRSPAGFIEKRRAMYEHIKAQVPEGLSVRLGAEVHFSGVNVPDYEELCALAIEGTKYILIELPFTTVWTKSLLNLLSEFIYETGYTPIIAHVERYQEVLKKPSLASELIRMGCLLQVNTQAFLDKREKKFAFALLRHGFVHCIGSDTHDMENRAPVHLTAKETVASAGFEAEWERAQEIMEKILAGEQVRVEEGTPIKKFLGRYM